jgi:hypothetical protein
MTSTIHEVFFAPPAIQSSFFASRLDSTRTRLVERQPWQHTVNGRCGLVGEKESTGHSDVIRNVISSDTSLHPSDLETLYPYPCWFPQYIS